LRQDIKVSDLRVEVVDVAFGQLEQPSLASDVLPSLVDQTGSLDPALLLTFSAVHGLRAGTYDVGVRIHTVGTPTEEQRIDLHITHPPAVLAPVPTIIVVQTIAFPGAEPTIELSSIQLRETTGLTRLTQVAIAQDNPATSDGATVGGHLRFDVQGSVPPRGVSKLPFTLEGDFPVGTATGSLVVDSPQLQAPVTLAFEVHTKRGVGWLFLVGAVGLFVGLAARVWLKGRIALQDAKVQAEELLQTIDSELARRPDRDFQIAVKAARNDLNQAATGSDPKKISDATQRASGVLQDALTALATRRKDKQTELDGLAKELGVPWRLPAPMRALLTDATKSLSNAANHLANDDVSGAAQGTDTAMRTLIAGLRTEASDVQAKLTSLIEFLLSPDPPMEMGVAADATALVTQIKNALAVLATGKPDIAIHDALIAADSTFAPYTQLVTAVLPQLLTMADDVAATLRQGGPDDPAAVAKLLTASDSLRSMLVLVAGSADPGAAPQIQTALGGLLAAARLAILNQRKTAPVEARTKVEGLIAKGAYRDAARAIVAIVVAPSDRLLGTKPGQVDVALEPPGPSDASRVASLQLPVGGGFALLTTTGAPAPPAIRLKTDRSSLIVAQAVQTIILGFVLLVIGYALYAPHFVGTPSELAAIFLWAFAADVTVDAVLNARSSIPAAASSKQ
jgi:hypothetical protein